MNFSRFLVLLTTGFALTTSIFPQGMDPAHLLNPTKDSWPGYNGDYSGMRHSPLAQVTRENVAQLSLAWAFQTGLVTNLKSTPILVNGILYFTSPDNVWAVDARSGHQALALFLSRPIRDSISVIAGYRCTAIGCSTRLRTRTWSR